jgi:hypothetical protein
VGTQPLHRPPQERPRIQGRAEAAGRVGGGERERRGGEGGGGGGGKEEQEETKSLSAISKASKSRDWLGGQAAIRSYC